MVHHHLTRPIRPILLALVPGVALLLAACNSGGSTTSQGFVHIDESATQTAVAITQQAQANPSPTPGPSPTPLPTLPPYVIPTAGPGVDQNMVITHVGNVDITLGQFEKQVRYERWKWLFQVIQLLNQRGAPQVLDLNKPENTTIASVFATLDDYAQLGEDVHRVMIIDAISLEEARRRGIDVDPQQFDAILAQNLGLTVNTAGELPPEFGTVYADFLAGLTTYTGMTEEEFRRIIRARTLYKQLEFIISNQPEADQRVLDASTGVVVHGLLLDTNDLANDVVARLQGGESLDAIATSLGFVRNENQQTIVHTNDTSLPDDVRAALFAASPDEIVGPLETSQGWYVAVVGNPVFDQLSPDDTGSIKQQYFLDWVEALMDDPAYVQDFDDWRDTIPQGPRPEDVSALLSADNVILPGEN